MERDREAVVPMTKILKLAESIFRGAMIFLLAVALGLFTVKQFRLIYLSRIPPVTFHAMVIDPDVLAPGDPLFVTAVLTRHRFCWSERKEWIADADTNTNKWEATFANGSTDLGFTKIRNQYSIPVLPHGEYVLRMIAIYRCGVDDTHVIRGPDATFRVTH